MLALVLLAGALELPVPYVAQEKDTCGAAALTMVLRYWGAAASHEAIAAALVEEELRGIRGSRLADFAREQGMVAIAFAGDATLAREHLRAGRPLVLALDAGRGRFHDVVAVGFEEGRGEWVLHDPARGPRRRMAEAELERRWAKSGRWTLLVQPGPTAADPSSSDAHPSSSDATEALRGEEGYEALLAGALELGRAGRHEEALARLARAVALDPARPEAWTERGGLEFLEGRYEEAIADLRRSVSIQDEPYARELLAASLHLAGRELEALAAWNPLGRPTLRGIETSGLARTREGVALREVGLEEGGLLTAAGLRAARLRLAEVGVFERVTLRPHPRGDGTARLEVALVERHGLARGPLDFVVTTGVDLAWKRLRLRYANLGGTGVSLGASHRWQENRPETVLLVQWPRPLGIPATLRLSGFRGEQPYEAGGAVTMRRRGIDVSARHVLGGGSVATFGLRLRERAFSSPHPDAPPGLLAGVEGGLELPLVETPRHRLDGTGRVFAGAVSGGGGGGYLQADGELRYEGLLSKPEGRSVERSVLAARLRVGWGGRELPLDEMYAPGVSPESDLPLRAHPLTRHGVIGANPIGRSILLLNAEWRVRLVHHAAWDLGAVVFSDAAWVLRPPSGSASGWLHDVGVGLRVSLLAGPTLRIDHARGLRDGRRALYVGLGHAF